jgi:hypothetical protein
LGSQGAFLGQKKLQNVFWLDFHNKNRNPYHPGEYPNAIEIRDFGCAKIPPDGRFSVP